MGLSLSDQYWVKTIDDPIEWEKVNFFDNLFSTDVGNLLFGRPISGEFDLSSPDNTSDGVLRKRWTIVDNERQLVKSGNEPSYQEPLNEVISTRSWIPKASLTPDTVSYGMMINRVPYVAIS